MMPCACACSRASATWRASRRASGTGIAPAASRSASGGPLDELQDQRAPAARLLRAVEDADVRVMKRGEQLRLALEAGHALGVGREGLADQLERHVPTQADVAGPPHLAHPPGAEPGQDLEGTEARSGSEAHREALSPFVRAAGAEVNRPKDCREPCLERCRVSARS